MSQLLIWTWNITTLAITIDTSHPTIANIAIVKIAIKTTVINHPTIILPNSISVSNC